MPFSRIFDRLTGVPRSTILHQSHNMELYFEVDDIGAFTEKAAQIYLDVETGASADDACVAAACGAPVRSDWHMIEVSESMEHIALRLLDEGPFRGGDRRAHPSPTDFVEQCRGV